MIKLEWLLHWIYLVWGKGGFGIWALNSFFFHDDSEISDCITFSESVIDIDSWITKASKLLRLTSVVFVFFPPSNLYRGSHWGEGSYG